MPINYCPSDTNNGIRKVYLRSSYSQYGDLAETVNLPVTCLAMSQSHFLHPIHYAVHTILEDIESYSITPNFLFLYHLNAVENLGSGRIQVTLFLRTFGWVYTTVCKSAENSKFGSVKLEFYCRSTARIQWKYKLFSTKFLHGNASRY